MARYRRRTRHGQQPQGLRAVIYRRVSSAQQVETGLGLGDQLEKLEAYCKLRGLEVVEVVTDEGQSGGKPLATRPGGRRVLSLIKQKKVDAVVVLKLDRAFRKAVDALSTVEEWDKAGIALHVADMGGASMDTSRSGGKMFLTMLAGFAEFERNLVAERTTDALAHKVRIGELRLGADAPFGWRHEGDTLAEAPEEQAIIACVHALRAGGVSLRGVCAELTRLGHRNRAGGVFQLAQIQRMLDGALRHEAAA